MTMTMHPNDARASLVTTFRDEVENMLDYGLDENSTDESVLAAALHLYPRLRETGGTWPETDEALDSLATEFPPAVTEALTTIQESLGDGSAEPDEIADLRGTYTHVTNGVYLPGSYKPGASEFEPQGDDLSDAYLVVLTYESTL